MFGCALCGSKSSEITWLGFVVLSFCKNCNENRLKECNEVFTRLHDEAVKREAVLPLIQSSELTEINVEKLQEVVLKKQQPELERYFRKIAESVYNLKISKLECNKNWHWYGGITQFVNEVVTFCYDRLKVYDENKTTALDYFTAAVANVYEQKKLQEWQDWAY